jgi:GNAT superfamily N-acetyltransferase
MGHGTLIFMQVNGNDKMHSDFPQNCQIFDIVKSDWQVRLAGEKDFPALEKLISLSARGLRGDYYSAAQIEAALCSVFGVDRQLIWDRTYFVAERAGELIGCGGWSKRKTLFGSDHYTNRDDAELDPDVEPARIRAFFIHPEWARHGIGRAILNECERAIGAAGFRSVELAATLPGEPFYAACGYKATEGSEVSLPNDLALQIVRMTKQLR